MPSRGPSGPLPVYVKHVAGQTVKIDGVQSGTTSLTNGIAMNRFV